MTKRFLFRFCLIALLALIAPTMDVHAEDLKLPSSRSIEEALGLPAESIRAGLPAMSMHKPGSSLDIFASDAHGGGRPKPSSCEKRTTYVLRTDTGIIANDSDLIITVGLCSDTSFKHEILARKVTEFVEALNSISVGPEKFTIPVPLTQLTLKGGVSADILTMPLGNEGGVLLSPTIIVHSRKGDWHFVLEAITHEQTTPYPIAHFTSELLAKGAQVLLGEIIGG